jgi:hypothetical protein
MPGDAMADERVISATFHTYRPVAGRKVLQLVFEVALEKDAETLSILGYPNIAEPNWYAIARLQGRPTVAESLTVSEANGLPKQEPSDEGKDLVRQCALTCKDVRFHTFLANKGWMEVVGEETATDRVRKMLGVKSRGELGLNDVAQRKWKMLHAEYRQHLTDEQYKDAR